MGCLCNLAAGIIRWIILIFNFAFWVCGAIILGIGIWLAVDEDAWEWLKIVEDGGMNTDLYATAVYMMITVGCLMFVVGFFGYCGAWNKNKCMLETYVWMVGFLLVLEFIAGILAACFKGAIDENIEEGMRSQIYYKYYKDDDLTGAWNNTQTNMECCGATGHINYFKSYYTNETGNSVPESCCVMDANGVPKDYVQCKDDADTNATISSSLHLQGCYTEMKNFIEEKSDVIMGILFALGIVQVVGLVFACIVKGRIDDD